MPRHPYCKEYFDYGDDLPPERLPGPIEPRESIAGMIQVIDGLMLEQSEGFIRCTGKPQPWPGRRFAGAG
jgi:hypothetical protein